MKSKILLFAVLLFTAGASATTHIISVGDFSFSPSSVPNVHIGDTMMWMWSSGTHTTSSTSSIPSGAAPWNANINSTSTSFIYVPTVAGTYNYQCNFHVSMGMVGSFTVVTGTSVAPQEPPVAVRIYPSPVKDMLHLAFGNAAATSVTLTNMNGQQVFATNVAPGQESLADLRLLPSGLYMLRAEQSGEIWRETVVVAH